MDDLIIPRSVKESSLPPIPAAPSFRSPRRGWHYFGEKPSSLESPAVETAPQLPQVITARYQAVPVLPTLEPAVQGPAEPQMQEAAAIVKETPAVTVAAAPQPAWAPAMTLFALADGSVFAASQYWRDQEKLVYFSSTGKSTISLRDIDWSATTRLNSVRNVRVVLRNAPVVTQN